MTDKKGCVLAVVAHPDDEVLGAGGTLARHRVEGSEVHIVFLADGVSARGDDRPAAERRAKAARLAASLLGAREPEFLGFPEIGSIRLIFSTSRARSNKSLIKSRRARSTPIMAAT